MGANADDDDDDEGLSLYRGKECLFDEYPGNDDDFSLKDMGKWKQVVLLRTLDTWPVCGNQAGTHAVEGM